MNARAIHNVWHIYQRYFLNALAGFGIGIEGVAAMDDNNAH